MVLGRSRELDSELRKPKVWRVTWCSECGPHRSDAPRPTPLRTSPRSSLGPRCVARNRRTNDGMLERRLDAVGVPTPPQSLLAGVRDYRRRLLLCLRARRGLEAVAIVGVEWIIIAVNSFERCVQHDGWWRTSTRRSRSGRRRRRRRCVSRRMSGCSWSRARRRRAGRRRARSVGRCRSALARRDYGGAVRADAALLGALPSAADAAGCARRGWAPCSARAARS